MFIFFKTHDFSKFLLKIKNKKKNYFLLLKVSFKTFNAGLISILISHFIRSINIARPTINNKILKIDIITLFAPCPFA